MKIVKRILEKSWLVFCALSSYFLFKIINRVKVVGRNNLPRDSRGVLFVSNHQTLVDSFLIGISVVSVFDILFHTNRVPWNAPDNDNFFRNRLGRFLMSLSKCVPAHRRATKKETVNDDINSFINILKNGSLVLFFEGGRTRNVNGDIGSCKYGVAETIRIAKPRKVIPICLKGIQPILPLKSGFNFLKIGLGHKGKIIIGSQIDFSESSDLEKIKGEIESAVKGLSN